jgi:hypothetical protein
LLQSAVLSTVTGEHDIGTEVAVSVKAHFAPSARQGRIDRHQLSVTRTALDYTGEFMPRHQRPGEPRIADAGFGEPVQVGSAQADGGDAHQFFSGARDRDGLGVRPDIADTVQSGSGHRVRHI